MEFNGVDKGPRKSNTFDDLSKIRDAGTPGIPHPNSIQGRAVREADAATLARIEAGRAVSDEELAAAETWYADITRERSIELGEEE